MRECFLVAALLSGCTRTLGLRALDSKHDELLRGVIEAVNSHTTGVVLYEGFDVSVSERQLDYLNACGVWNAGEQRIYLDFECTQGTDVVLVHEIGHALGLEHTEDESSVMYYRLRLNMSLDVAARSLAKELRQ